MSIQRALSDWDGKSADAIDTIYQTHCQAADFVDQIVSLLEQTSWQKGASWLLKRHFEVGAPVNKRTINKLYQLLPLLEHWETKLHILQCMPLMPVVPASKEIVEAFLRKCLTDNNKFVRAWAYNGFYELSLQHKEYQQEVKSFLEMAMKDEAPSVKARIRNIIKKGF